MSPGRAYAAALVRSVAASFAQGLKAADPAEAISFDLACKQHAAYVSKLCELIPQVVELPAEEALPDSTYVEDAAVVLEGEVLVTTRPGAPTRQSEVEAVTRALVRECGLSRARHHAIEAPGTLDGGDVLYLGDGLVAVGISARTNARGADQLAHALGSAFRVVTVPVGAATLHLKSPLSALDAATLLVGGSPAARALGHRTSEALRSHRRSLRMEVLQDDLAANVLAIGDGVVMQGGMPQSQERLQALCKQRRLHLHVIDQLTEFAKTDGALTCLSILAR